MTTVETTALSKPGRGDEFRYPPFLTASSDGSDVCPIEVAGLIGGYLVEIEAEAVIHDE